MTIARHFQFLESACSFEEPDKHDYRNKNARFNEPGNPLELSKLDFLAFIAERQPQHPWLGRPAEYITFGAADKGVV